MSNILLHYQNNDTIPDLQINHHFGSVDNIELEGNGKLCIQTPYLDVPFEVKQYENDRKSTNIALSLTRPLPNTTSGLFVNSDNCFFNFKCLNFFTLTHI